MSIRRNFRRWNRSRSKYEKALRAYQFNQITKQTEIDIQGFLQNFENISLSKQMLQSLKEWENKLIRTTVSSKVKNVSITNCPEFINQLHPSPTHPFDHKMVVQKLLLNGEEILTATLNVGLAGGDPPPAIEYWTPYLNELNDEDNNKFFLLNKTLYENWNTIQQNQIDYFIKYYKYQLPLDTLWNRDSILKFLGKTERWIKKSRIPFEGKQPKYMYKDYDTHKKFGNCRPDYQPILKLNITYSKNGTHDISFALEGTDADLDNSYSDEEKNDIYFINALLQESYDRAIFDEIIDIWKEREGEDENKIYERYNTFVEELNTKKNNVNIKDSISKMLKDIDIIGIQEIQSVDQICEGDWSSVCNQNCCILAKKDKFTLHKIDNVFIGRNKPKEHCAAVDVDNKLLIICIKTASDASDLGRLDQDKIIIQPWKINEEYINYKRIIMIDANLKARTEHDNVPQIILQRQMERLQLTLPPSFIESGKENDWKDNDTYNTVNKMRTKLQSQPKKGVGNPCNDTERKDGKLYDHVKKDWIISDLRYEGKQKVRGV